MRTDIHIKRAASALPGMLVFILLFRKLWHYRNHFGAIGRDILETRQSAKFLRNTDIKPADFTLNIFAVDDDSINTIKQLAFVTQGLRLRGWNIRVIFRNRSSILGKIYFRAFGIKNIVYIEDQRLNDEEKLICQCKKEELLNGTLSLQQVKSWTFEGCWIGPQIISTVSRLKFEGSVNFSETEAKRRTEEILGVTLESVMRTKKVISEYPANLAVTNEANYTAFGPLVDLSIDSGCNVIQMVQPWKDDALTLRRLTKTTRREHPSSVSRQTLDGLVEKTWGKAQEEALNKMFEDRYSGRWFLQNRNQINTHCYEHSDIQKRLGLDLEKRTAIVFSHVLWDANLFYGEDIFEDYGEWFVETVKAACKNSSLNWLIKVHPANVWKRRYENVKKEYAEHLLIRERIGELPKHVKLIDADNDISTYSLFNIANYGVTVRGTSGLELACFGKHCVTAGTGRYSGLGFTLDSANKSEYLGRLALLHQQSPMSKEEVLRAKWHAYAAFVLRPWSMVSATACFNYLKEGRGPLDHNLKINVASRSELIKNNDLERLADWATSNQIDYMESHDLLDKI